jgi:hypothetical protein
MNSVVRLLRAFLANLATLFIALLLAVIIWATAVRAADPVITNLMPLSVTPSIPGPTPLVSQANAQHRFHLYRRAGVGRE